MSLNATMGGLTGEVSIVFKLIFDGEITVDDIYGLEGVEKIEDGLLEGVQFLQFMMDGIDPQMS